MYCVVCGEKNPDKSKYCQHCGVEYETYKLQDGAQQKDIIKKQSSVKPYAISRWKLTILSISTLGLYEIYWFYKHWKSFSIYGGSKNSTLKLAILSIFAPITSYGLFSQVQKKYLQTANRSGGLSVGALAGAYFVLSRALLGFLPLLSVQDKINMVWEEEYKSKLVKNKFGAGDWFISITFIISLFLIWVYSEPPDITDFSTETEITSAVVNILCYGETEDLDRGGSGTIFSVDGIILTNSHIIPQNNPGGEMYDCLVVLPNPSTGQPEEIYWATPILVPEVSSKYDLALLQIYDSYFDEEEGVHWGRYPRVFPSFDDADRCTGDKIKLGERITIFGYPSLSGGNSLTVTEGLVSSFPGEGLIVTSAKISSGNSGGLAVDSKGCFVGIPTMVSYDESGSLGVLVSTELIHKFADEAAVYLEDK